MHESQMTTTTHQPLVMRWIPVRTATGRTVMESCWVPARDVAVAAALPELLIHHAA